MFHSKGYFSIKVTPLGSDQCLLEEGETDELKALIE